ncbi:hypothetical protein BASA81_012341 [Batrachochytrium salamandrivorans]|nr:hypothetical protein BASA81_012341 [Batrachochytrium salamandrivorans]
MKKSSATSCGLQVAVRVRPLNSREKSNAQVFEAIETGDTYLTVKVGEQETIYAFDSVFGVQSKTMDLFTQVAEPIVQSSMTGVNGTIFAYGQTSSGKTFTMQGSEQEPGILRLAASKLFAPSDRWSYQISVSYIEIYNERVKDLLATALGKGAILQEEPDLKIREDPTKGFFVEGVVEKSVVTCAELMDRFLEGEKKRHVAGTDMNEKSSRSHTIFSIHITAKPLLEGGGLFKSKLSLVDLAGSESGRSTNAEGERLKEGGQINKSLLTLSMVISSLAAASEGTGRAGASHVKFRDSKLTQILQPSLVGNCMTAVVCCVTPASTFVGETNSTLKFANSAKHLKTEFVVNQIVDANMRSAKGFQDQIEAVELALRREREQRHAEVASWQRQLEQEAAQTLQVQLLLDSARGELEMTRLAHSQVEEQASTSSSALEQLAQRSANEMHALTARFEQEIASRKHAEAALRDKAKQLDEELLEQNQVVAELTTELEDSTSQLDRLGSDLRAANSTAYEWKTVAEAKALELRTTTNLLQGETSRAAQLDSALVENQAKLQELTNALQMANKESIGLANEVQLAKRTAEQLHVQLVEVGKENSGLRANLTAEQAHNAKSASESNGLMAKSRELESELAKRSQLSVELAAELDSTKRQMEARAIAVGAQISLLQQEREDAERELVKTKQTAATAQTKLANSEELCTKVEARLESSVRDLEASRQTAAQLGDELRRSNDQVSTLQQSLSSVERTAKQEHAFVCGELAAFQSKCAELESQLVQAGGELQSQRAASESEATQQQARHLKLQGEFAQLVKDSESHVKDLASQASQLREERLGLEGEMEELRIQLAGAQEARAVLERELSSKQSTVVQLDQNLQAVNDRVLGLQQTMDTMQTSFALEREGLCVELCAFKHHTAELEVAIKASEIALESRSGEWEIQAAELEANLANAKADLILHREQSETLNQASREQLAALERETADRVAKLENKLCAANESIEQLTGEVSATNALLAEKAGEIAQLDGEVKTAKEQAWALQESLSSTGESAKQECGLLRGELAASKERCGVAESRLAKAEALLNELHSSKAALETELQHAEANCTAAAGQIDSLGQQLVANNTTMGELEEALKGKTSELRQHLQLSQREMESLVACTKQEYDELSAQLGASKEANCTLESRLTMAETALVELRDGKATVEAKLQHANASMEALQSEFVSHQQRAEASSEAAEVKLALLEQQLVASATMANKAEEAITSQAARKVEELGRELEASRHSCAELYKLIDEANARLGESDRLKLALESELHQALSVASDQLTAEKQQVFELERALQSQLDELTCAKLELGANNASNHTLQSQCRAMESELEVLNGQLQHLEFNALALEQSLAGSQNAVAALTEAVANKDQLLESLNASFSQTATTQLEIAQQLLGNEADKITVLQLEINALVQVQCGIELQAYALVRTLQEECEAERERAKGLDLQVAEHGQANHDLAVKLDATAKEANQLAAESANDKAMLMQTIAELKHSKQATEQSLHNQLELVMNELTMNKALVSNNNHNSQLEIGLLQEELNANRLELRGVLEDHMFATQELLEWAKVDADRLVWERTSPLEDELQRVEHERDELQAQMQDKDMYIKCLQVETDQLQLGRAGDRERALDVQCEQLVEMATLQERHYELEQIVCALQHELNVQAMFRDAEDVEHALALTNARHLAVQHDDKLLRQREDALLDLKHSFAHMKKTKDFWIAHLQSEINELAIELEAHQHLLTPLLFSQATTAEAAVLPLAERQEKRGRFEEENEEEVENRGEFEQMLQRLCKLVGSNSVGELDVQVNSALKRMEGELTLLRERNAKLEKAKLTQAQAEQINQLKKDYLALKQELASAKPAGQESVAKYEQQCLEANRTRDDALGKLRHLVEQQQAQQEVVKESAKFEVQRLERENLMLYKRVRELGGFPNL